MIPGEIMTAAGDIELNQGADVVMLKVANSGDRPVQVGSHCHFFEVNRCLSFDRQAAFGMRLNIAAGTAVRFEPGDTRQVELVGFGGGREAFGINRLTEGALDEETNRTRAIARAADFAPPARNRQA